MKRKTVSMEEYAILLRDNRFASRYFGGGVAPNDYVGRMTDTGVYIYLSARKMRPSRPNASQRKAS